MERNEFRSSLQAYYAARVLQRPVAAFNARQESEADSISLLLLANAGYDPRAAASFWDRMGAAGRPRLGDFAEHHGGHGDRGQQLQPLMASAVAIYDSRADRFGRGASLASAQTRAASKPAEARPASNLASGGPAGQPVGAVPAGSENAEKSAADRAAGKPLVVDDGWRSSGRASKAQWVASEL